MSPPIRLRFLTPSDLAFAEVVRAAAGWNQTPDDWRRFLELEPNGCFLAEWEGAPAGTATTMVHGPELAWIGMVLVHPDYRRRGVGRALLEHCLEHLEARGARCIKLDATPLGQPVYERLGFRREWTLSRWERAGAPAATAAALHEPRFGRARLPPSRRPSHHDPARQEPRPTGFMVTAPGLGPKGSSPEPPLEPRGFGVRQSTAAFGPAPSETKRQRTAALQDAVACGCAPRRFMAGEQFREQWEALDAAAFGVARSRLWDALERQRSSTRAVVAADGTVAAFGLTRPGSRARYLGPVVATSPEAGLAVIEALLAEHPEEPVFWDIPEPNEAAVAWAGAHGFQRQRPLTRMYRGENLNPGDPCRQFALAGPEVG